jgi:hypothetical protein
MKSWVGRFVIDHGRVTEEGQRLRSFQRRRLEEPEVDLHVLAEPREAAGGKGEELAAQTVDAIGRVFDQDRLSLTGGLQRALAGTHQTLMEWNRRSLPREQVSVSVVSAVVRDNLVYLARAGPCIVYVRRSGEVVRLDDATPALGETGDVPAIRRFELEAGDLVLAATTNLDAVTDTTTIESVLTRAADEVLPELYLLTRDLTNFALFAISGVRDVDAQPEATDADGLVETENEGFSANASGAGGPATSAVRTLGGVEGGAAVAVLEVEPVVAAGAAAPALEVVAREAVARSQPPVEAREDTREYLKATGPRRRFRPSLGQVRLLQAGASLAVVVLLAYFVPGVLQKGRSEKVADLVDGAQTQLAAADVEGDPARKRSLLEESRRLATNALHLDPGNEMAAMLRQQASAGLVTMDAVVDLGSMTAVTTLTRLTAGEVAITGLVVQGGSAYLLDGLGGRVMAVSLGDPGLPAVVFEAGQTYGGVAAKAPAQMTWEGADAGGRLLVLDADRKLFEVRPGSAPQPLALRRTDTWSSAAGLAAFNGNLYVLDPAANQVHRYLPAAVGFDSEPSLVLEGQSGLARATELAVDGDVFVGMEKGEVRRFRSGRRAAFGLGGIDEPVERAVDIAVLAASDEVYIADAGNRRVVVASRDGVFKRQLVAAVFGDLRAIAIDAAASQLYVVAGDTLVTAPLPR